MGRSSQKWTNKGGMDWADWGSEKYPKYSTYRPRTFQFSMHADNQDGDILHNIMAQHQHY